jgi:glycosyltransferase involved in cell wall biosynthesis
MRRILVVTYIPTPPPNSGAAVRILSMVELLKRFDCEMHFLFICRNTEPIPTIDGALKEFWKDKLHIVTPASRKLAKFSERPLLRLWQSLCWRWFHWFRGGRLPVDTWYEPTVGITALELHRKYSFDTILLEFIDFSKLLLLFGPEVHKVIDSHDAQSLLTDRCLRQGRSDLLYLPMSARQERKGINRADTVIAIQDEEKNYFQQLTNKPVFQVGHILSTVCRYHYPSTSSILFIAGKSRVTTQAVNWILDHVFTCVRREIPDAVFTIAGRVGGDFQSNPDQGVSIIGEVEEVEPLYRSHSVVINPVQFGGGLAIKSIEALAVGRPLVTTRAGARGLSAAIGRGLFVADEPKEFASALVGLLRNRSSWEAASAAAVKFAEEYNAAQIASLKKAFRLD